MKLLSCGYTQTQLCRETLYLRIKANAQLRGDVENAYSFGGLLIRDQGRGGWFRQAYLIIRPSPHKFNFVPL